MRSQAINICTHILRDDGTFVAKIFRGPDISLLYNHLKIFFGDVMVTKPRSSRSSSLEEFVVCRGYRAPDGYKPTIFNPMIDDDCEQYYKSIEEEPNKRIIPFLACGNFDGYADKAVAKKEVS